jgi:hypothetical protein
MNRGGEHGGSSNGQRVRMSPARSFVLECVDLDHQVRGGSGNVLRTASERQNCGPWASNAAELLGAMTLGSADRNVTYACFTDLLPLAARPQGL